MCAVSWPRLGSALMRPRRHRLTPNLRLRLSSGLLKIRDANRLPVLDETCPESRGQVRRFGERYAKLAQRQNPTSQRNVAHKTQTTRHRMFP